MSSTGIGGRLGSRRAGRRALTRLGSPEFYTAARRWFFAVTPDALAGSSAGGGVTTGALTVAVAIPANPWRAGLAKVTGGWGGSVTITSGAISVVVSPPARTSAIELIDTVARAAQRAIGGTWSWWTSANGELVITASAAFDLVATGTSETRLGFTGTYSGSPGYVADDAHADGIYPTLGILLDGADGISRSGGVLATGLYVSGVARGDQGGNIDAYGTFAELVAMVEDFTAAVSWDVVLGGTWATRVRIDGIARGPWGASPDRTILSLSTAEVSL